MAALAGGEEGTRAARLQSFFTSVLSGLFGQAEGEEEMATRNHNAAAAAPQLRHNRGEPTDPEFLDAAPSPVSCQRLDFGSNREQAASVASSSTRFVKKIASLLSPSPKSVINVLCPCSTAGL